MATALSVLRERSRVLYDVAGSQVLDDDEWDQLINDSYRKLWRTVVRINKSFRINTQSFVLGVGANSQRSFSVTVTDTTSGANWAFANGAFASADVGKNVSPKFDSPNQAFNLDYKITDVLSPTFVTVDQSPADVGTFVVPSTGIVQVTGGQIVPLRPDYRETYLVRLNPGTAQQAILVRQTPRIAAQSRERSYRIQGPNLVIEPLGRCAGTFDHLYIPNAPVLTDDTDELDAELDQFAEYIPYDVANVALAREESERAYEVDFQRCERDVVSFASSQRSADPDVVEDVKSRSRWNWNLA